MKNNRVKVELVGGVGNQLFQVFAGMLLAKVNKSHLVIDTSLIGVNGTLHKSLISDFDISLEFSHSNLKRFYEQTIIARAFRGICRRIGLARLVTESLLRRYQSLEIGYDDKLLLLNPPITISGYFQTPRYFEAFQATEKIELKLKTHSIWFEEKLSQMEGKRILGIHVRRGDYKNLRDTFGLLDRSYYEKAISQALSVDSYDEIWIFSDDLKEAKFLLQGIKNLKPVQEPAGVNPLETMVLLSKCDGIIISNSTFAWWGAKMSTHSNVYMPNPWFKNERYSEDLLIHDWSPIKSSWAS